MTAHLSARMLMNARLVPVCDTAADIGCDHGKLSVYLIEKKIATKVIAMDVAKGPLERAVKTINDAGLADRIITRLSDGAKELKLDDNGRSEAGVIIMAGIGGMLALKMVEDSPAVYKTCDCFIIQAQSNIDTVRERMNDMGYSIIDEDMVYEDGKYYTAIKYRYNTDDMTGVSYITLSDDGSIIPHRGLSTEELIYGPVLIDKCDQVLHEYLIKESRNYKDIYNNLASMEGMSARTDARKDDILKKSEITDGLLHRVYGQIIP